MTYPFMKCAQASQMPLQGIIIFPLKVSSAIEMLSIVNWIGVLPICCLKGSCIGHPNGQFTATITQFVGITRKCNLLTQLMKMIVLPI